MCVIRKTLASCEFSSKYDSSQLASWAHGIVHLMEGDRANAGYWYRRAARDLPDDVQIEREIAALKAEIARA